MRVHLPTMADLTLTEYDDLTEDELRQVLYHDAGIMFSSYSFLPSQSGQQIRNFFVFRYWKTFMNLFGSPAHIN